MSGTLSVEARLRLSSFTLETRFEAPSGVTCVFGPSGAGKSLLLSVIAGTRRMQSGRIALGQRVFDDENAHMPAHRRGVGLVFQDARLFPHLSVRGNLMYAERRAPPGARKVSLEQAAVHFGLTTLLDRGVRHLSGGEKNRVALARALLSAPDLLLLDEPFAALDGARRAAFLTTLREMHEAFALPMLVVSHQIEDAAALADHLVGIDSGRVVAAGPLAQTAMTPRFRALLAQRDIGAALPAEALRLPATAGARSAWIKADHVLIATTEPQGLSARNIWRSALTALDPEGDTALLARLETPHGDVLARITRDAALDLKLAPGQTVWAIVKAHSI